MLFTISFTELEVTHLHQRVENDFFTAHACVQFKKLNNKFSLAQTYLNTEAPIVPKASLARWSLSPLATCNNKDLAMSNWQKLDRRKHDKGM